MCSRATSKPPVEGSRFLAWCVREASLSKTDIKTICWSSYWPDISLLQWVGDTAIQFTCYDDSCRSLLSFYSFLIYRWHKTLFMVINVEGSCCRTEGSCWRTEGSCWRTAGSCCRTAGRCWRTAGSCCHTEERLLKLQRSNSEKHRPIRWWMSEPKPSAWLAGWCLKTDEMCWVHDPCSAFKLDRVACLNIGERF